MNEFSPIAEAGNGHGRKPATFNESLVQTGAGTSMGELLRRYWQPVGISSKVKDRPVPVRIMGEDLILFRNASGRVGVLHSRCTHRGASLYYGRVDGEGLRCCYHGWSFSPEGQCLDQPCEKDGGRHKDKIRQPWYPAEERYGLIFAYMGPLDRKPVLPRYDALEGLEPGEFYENYDKNHPASGSVTIVPCNWLQYYENTTDPLHVPILHTRFSVVHFAAEFGDMPEIEWHNVETGIVMDTTRIREDGRKLKRISEVYLPNVRAIPAPRLDFKRCAELSWIVPVDDTSFRQFEVARVNKAGYWDGRRVRYGDKFWFEMSEEEHQMFPGDYEAIVGLGPITMHSEEHLAGSDRGVAMLRRMLTQQMKIVEEGGNPVGVSFDPDSATVKMQSRQEIID